MSTAVAAPGGDKPKREYVDAGPVAEQLCVGRNTVLKWAREKKIPSVRPAGRRPILFDLDAVLKHVEAAN